MAAKSPEVVGHLTGEEIVALCRKHTIFEWSVQTKVDPIPVARAEGVYFWTPEGKRFLDFNSQLMCTNIGHSHPQGGEGHPGAGGDAGLREPVHGHRGARAAGREAGRDHARRHRHVLLHERRRGGGGERDPHRARRHRAPQDPGPLSLVPRRHGGRADADRRSAPLGLGARASPAWCASPTSTSGGGRTRSRWTTSCATSRTSIRYEGGHTIAAVIVETVVGTNGILIPPDGYMQGLREICDAHGILLIADEVMAGFGRTGRWFADRPLGRRARPDDHGQGPDVRLRAAGRGRHAARRSRASSRRGRSPAGSPTTAIPWPARPRWPRSPSTRTRGSSRTRARWATC